MRDASELLSRPMMVFNQLPSLTLHPSRYDQFAPMGWPQHCAEGNARVSAIWHRHWSREILRRLDLVDRPVVDTATPELQLALLSPPELAVCAARMGATLCGDRLRRAIIGKEVRLLIDAFGEDALAFARGATSRGYPSLDGVKHWDIMQTVQRARTLGWCALTAALTQTPPELFMRAQLKLPDVGTQTAPLEAAEALYLGLLVLARERR